MSEAQRALITGGAGDLATAIATELSNSGVQLLAPGREQLDVTDEAGVAGYAKAVGKLDLLICNAGMIRDALLARTSEAVWDELIEVNLSGAARVARLIGKKLKRGGSLVLIGSYSGFHPPIGQCAYAAAKAGLTGLNHSLAREWGRRGVRCNLIVPGFMETRMTASSSANVRSEALAKHHLGSFNDPESVAKFIRFLHESLPHTSGQTFNLDSRVLS